MLKRRARRAAHYFEPYKGEIMKFRIALGAVALAIAGVAAKADNPSDAPLLTDNSAPQIVDQQRAQRAHKKERASKTEQTSNQQACPEVHSQPSAGGMQ